MRLSTARNRSGVEYSAPPTTVEDGGAGANSPIRCPLFQAEFSASAPRLLPSSRQPRAQRRDEEIVCQLIEGLWLLKCLGRFAAFGRVSWVNGCDQPQLVVEHLQQVVEVASAILVA